jgi:glycosyltransferase involved in cell wall biosynthesis
MRIGFAPALDKHGGGIYQYSQTMLSMLHEWSRSTREHEFVTFTLSASDAVAQNLRAHGLPVEALQPESEESPLIRKLKFLPGARVATAAARRLRQMLAEKSEPIAPPVFDINVIRQQPDIGQHLRRHGIELMIYPMPNTLSFECGIPYVMAVHDLQHRLQPHFPEVSANGQWELREYLFRNGIRDASAILVDSEVGKEDVLEFYATHGAQAERVHVLPFLPAHYLSADVSEDELQHVKERYQLPDDYLFYPAQFWPHKNHIGIVRALAILKNERRLVPPVLFCGAASDEIREQNYAALQIEARELGVSDQIHYIGYVPDGDMSALYTGASALVMPTFFGPTNIPVLEAWACCCPVLTSDIRGIREQVGDAALLADPASPEAIADAIARIITDNELRDRLISSGMARLASYSPEEYGLRLRQILSETITQIRRRAPAVVRAGLLAHIILFELSLSL